MEKRFLVYIVLFLIYSCKITEDARPSCIQDRIKTFTQETHSFSVEWVKSGGQTIYRFRSAREDLYLDENCDTTCHYLTISSFLPPCKIELDKAAWKKIWSR